MAFGIEGVDRMVNRPLAQIVIPVAVGGAEGNLNLNAVRMVGTLADQDGEKTQVDMILVPEPATMGLLAIGGALVLARRRRRA